MRRILLISGFAILVVAIGFAIYIVFFKSPAPSAPQGGAPQGPATGGLVPSGAGLKPGAPVGTRAPEASSVARGGLTRAQTITTRPAAAASLDLAGNGARFYDKNSGKFYRIGFDGAERELSDKAFYNAKDITWSPTKDAAIIEYPDGANVYFDFASGVQSTLPKHWQEFSFSPDGSRIAGLAIGEAPENRFLIVANPDGSGASAIEPLGENASKVQVSWSPNNQVIAFSRTGESLGFGREEVLFIGAQGENFRSAIVEGLGFSGKWSGDGARVLYSVYSPASGYRPELWVTDGAGDAIGGNRRRINLETWVDKCAFADANTAYCAVPASLPEGAAFAPEVADSVPDLIYKVDLATGARTLAAEPDVRASLSNLVITRDGSALFFTDKQTGELFRLQLAQ